MKHLTMILLAISFVMASRGEANITCVDCTPEYTHAGPGNYENCIPGINVSRKTQSTEVAFPDDFSDYVVATGTGKCANSYACCNPNPTSYTDCYPEFNTPIT